MELYALYGKSGTGKSTSALSFAYSHGITTIIDDGLLIHNGRKAAGTSAKYEKTYITAVKRAIFFYDDHARDVQEALRTLAINKLLIIGTSIKMVNRIADRLGLGTIDHYFSVEDVRSSKEIKMALYTRQMQEKHVIPLPYKEVEQNIFKRIMQRGKKIFFQQRKLIGETTIIQPNFQDGMIHIDDQVFKQIISKSCESLDVVKKCSQVEIHIEHLPCIKVHLILHYSAVTPLSSTIAAVQQTVFNDFLYYFQIEPAAIDVHIKQLDVSSSVT
ncbi:isopentenyl transferase family protein [Alkalihalobacillus oceani]|uniref:isopentenyl transferase family protein n=1 Tax=Halalkalibacter oceani TaxID=1653776 RepID=UPI00203B6EAE|nr:isopentenyl transferase family protein [Halalkalibacter oceani]MCM3760099.1 isopentenyl transferase family protein [Halalkalibacter oceani]